MVYLQIGNRPKKIWKLWVRNLNKFIEVRSKKDSMDVVGVNRRHLETKEAIESDLEAIRSAIEDENRIAGRKILQLLGKS